VEAKPWTSREATNAKDAPRRLVVLGGGVVGLEMAQAWNALGSEQVTVLEHGDRLLPRVEAFAGELVADALREDGIDLRLGATVVRVERPHPSGEVLVHLEDGTSLVGDELLVAAGAPPPRPASVSTWSVSSRGASCRSTTRCGSPGRTGCTPPATSTAGSC
jgi:dihydrolipoamide dehydrogenase